MPVIAALLTLFILAICFAIMLVFWAGIALLLVPRRRRAMFMCLSLPVYVLVVIAAHSFSTRPSVLFHDSFGFDAPTSVHFIHSWNWYLGDFGSTYLHFVANGHDIDRIVAARQLSRMTGSPNEGSILHVNDEPKWWNPQFAPNVNVYWNGSEHRDFGREDSLLYHNRDTGETFFRFIGID